MKVSAPGRKNLRVDSQSGCEDSVCSHKKGFIMSKCVAVEEKTHAS